MNASPILRLQAAAVVAALTACAAPVSRAAVFLHFPFETTNGSQTYAPYETFPGALGQDFNGTPVFSFTGSGGTYNRADSLRAVTI